MKRYLQVLKNNIIKMIISLFFLLLPITIMSVSIVIVDKNILYAIPVSIILFLVFTLLYSLYDDKSLTNYTTYLYIAFLTLIFVIICISIIIGILALIIWLLMISIWFSIPIFIILLLTHSFLQYIKEKEHRGK